MNDCSKCCFFRSDAWCYRKLRYVRPDSQVCMQFIGGVTSEEIEELATLAATVARRSNYAVSFSDGTVTTFTADSPKETKKPPNGPRCFSCEFYCSTPPNDGRCNVTLQPVGLCDLCDQYTPYIPRHSTTYEPYIPLHSTPYEQLIDSLGIVVSDKICLSCGSPIRISTRGRRKYCAVCGCYLPEILYDDHFLDATKTINPMAIPRPSPMPTRKSH